MPRRRNSKTDPQKPAATNRHETGVPAIIAHDPVWADRFIERFAPLGPRPANSIAISLKVRATGGCFHREHSPHAYAIIDEKVNPAHLQTNGIIFEEHETGPEFLAYLAIGAAGLAVTSQFIGLLKELVGLATAIVKARSEGLKKGDNRNDPVELIVRGISPQGNYAERTLAQIVEKRTLTEKQVQQLVDQAITEMFNPHEPG